jgi:hypothetical protein
VPEHLDRLSAARHALGVKGMPNADVTTLLRPVSAKVLAPESQEKGCKAADLACFEQVANRPNSEPDPESAQVPDDENFKMITIPYHTRTMDPKRPLIGKLKIRIPTAHWHTDINPDIIATREESDGRTEEIGAKFDGMLKGKNPLQKILVNVTRQAEFGKSSLKGKGWQYHKMVEALNDVDKTLLWAAPPPFGFPGDDEPNPPGSKSRKKAQIQRLKPHGRSYVFTHWTKTNMPKLVDPIRIPADQAHRLPGGQESLTIRMLSTQVLLPTHLKDTPNYKLYHGTYRVELNNGDTHGIPEKLMNSLMDFPERTPDPAENLNSSNRKVWPARTRSKPKLHRKTPKTSRAPESRAVSSLVDDDIEMDSEEDEDGEDGVPVSPRITRARAAADQNNGATSTSVMP